MRKESIETRDSESSSSSNNEIVLMPARQFWRRLFRTNSSASSTTSSPSNKRNKRKNRNRSHGEDEKSACSNSSSSQSGSDESEPHPNRQRRLAKYFSIDTTKCQPICLISNEGDLSLWRSSIYLQQDPNNDDDYDDEDESMSECRDDVGLLNESRIFQSHLMHTPRALREQIEEEDRVALLSEHDDLFENRRGSYNVDCVDHLAINGAAALQKLSLLSLKQDLMAYEEKLNYQMANMLPRKKQFDGPRLTIDSKQGDEPLDQEEIVPLQIRFPSGETTQGVAGTKTTCRKTSSPVIPIVLKAMDTSSGSTSTSPPPAMKPAVVSPSSADGSIEGDSTLSSTALNPLGEEPPAYSEIIYDRTQKHKAFYLLRLRNSQRKANTTQRPSPHGDLWTLAELPSEDDSSRLSQISGGLAALQRSGSGGSKKKQRVILQDKVDLMNVE